MAALLVAGSNRSVSVALDDLPTRSRRFLSRGLALSGALHLGLALLVLWLSSRGDEGVLRLNKAPVVVVPEIVAFRLPPPPAMDPRASSGFKETETGVFQPVIDTRPIETKFSDPVVSGFERTTDTRPVQGNHRPGVLPGPPDDVVYDARNVQVPPVAIYSPKPVYPPFAEEARITGDVLLRVEIGTDGLVKKVTSVVKSRIFSETSERAILTWRFKPALMNGTPVPVVMEIPVHFRL